MKNTFTRQEVEKLLKMQLLNIKADILIGFDMIHTKKDYEFVAKFVKMVENINIEEIE